MMQLLYLSLFIFLGYITFSCLKFGIPKSISETSYLFGLKAGNIVFFAFCITVVMLLLPFWLEVTAGTSLQFMIFLQCAGLAFVGVTGKFKDTKHENTVHNISAYTCALMASLWQVITIKCMVFVAPIIFVLMFILGKNIKGSYRNLKLDKIEKSDTSTIFWLELGCFIIQYLSIFAYIYKN